MGFSPSEPSSCENISLLNLAIYESSHYALQETALALARELPGPIEITIGAMVEAGMSDEDILQAYPDLEREDIREALRYAAAALQERELPLLPSP